MFVIVAEHYVDCNKRVLKLVSGLRFVRMDLRLTPSVSECFLYELIERVFRVAVMVGRSPMFHIRYYYPSRG